MITITKIDSFKDFLGQDISVGDIVLYPKMVSKHVELVLAKVLKILQKIDYYKRKWINVRLRVIDTNIWKYILKYPLAESVIGFYLITLTRHADNLIRVEDLSKLTELEYDVLINGIEVPVYQGLITKNKQYNIDDIKKAIPNYNLYLKEILEKIN